MWRLFSASFFSAGPDLQRKIPSISTLAGQRNPNPRWQLRLLCGWRKFVLTFYGSGGFKRITQRAPNPPEFAQPRLSRAKRRSYPARGYKYGCVCSYMAGTTQVCRYKFGCVWSVSFRPHFALLKRGCANSGGFGARWITPETCFAWGWGLNEMIWVSASQSLAKGQGSNWVDPSNENRVGLNRRCLNGGSGFKN